MGREFYELLGIFDFSAPSPGATVTRDSFARWIRLDSATAARPTLAGVARGGLDYARAAFGLAPTVFFFAVATD